MSTMQRDPYFDEGYIEEADFTTDDDQEGIWVCEACGAVVEGEDSDEESWCDMCGAGLPGKPALRTFWRAR